MGKYESIEPDWGYGELGKFTYYRTYSRKKEDGTQEHWVDTVRRVVEGTYELQFRHCSSNGLDWDSEKAKESAEEMFDRMFNMKFLPPGRGLWMMGTSYVMERENGAPLQNCGFISTKALHEGSSRPFTWLMDMSMLGVGVGFDTLGAGAPVYAPNKNYQHTHEVEDSREGWVDVVRKRIDSYLKPNQIHVVADTSKVRKAGEPINGFGGTASGPAPLIKLLDRIEGVLDTAAKRGHITSTDIVDIQNMIGACVVAGNVRRSAEIALGDVNDLDFLDLKNYEVNPHRAEWSWASNNSLIIRDGDDPDYTAIAERIANNGEPGLVYIDNARKNGRMGDVNALDDSKVMGFNPCAEQQLEDGELCNLVEVFPTRCDGIVDYLRTLKFAYLYAKTVTLIPTHDDQTNEVMFRNRRIGTSNSGITQFIHTKGRDILEQWLEAGYGYIDNLDRKYSSWLSVPLSVRKTTVKPSGTVSLLAGVTPGVHYPVADTHIRRVRVQEGHPLADVARDAGYHIEPDQYSDNTMVIEFPIKGLGVPDERSVSIFDKADVATFMAKHWADNAVSCTITFDPESESSMIETVLRQNKDKWKTVSFLKISNDTYPQMPYESISEGEFESKSFGIQPMDFSTFTGDGEMEKFCTTDKCEINLDFAEEETVS